MGIDVVLNDESKRETPSMINFGDKQRFAAPEAIFEAAAPLIARRTVDELSLTQAYDALVSAVRERVASVPGRDAAVAATVRPQIVIDSSMTCVNFRINCGGDNRDTNYIRAPAF